jgi:beta-lactamase regulating signal transducer with metallopeptidase domain
LLPIGAVAWDDARLSAVLQHELAHIARRDLLVEMLAEVAVALYWYHPLAWLAARRENLAREQACDDAVLRSGAAAAEYASTLLALARTGRTATPSAVLALSRTSALETRVVALLDPSRSRSRASRRGRVGVFAAIAVASGLGLVDTVPVAVPQMRHGQTSPCPWCRLTLWSRG